MKRIILLVAMACAVACQAPETRATGSDSAYDKTLNAHPGVFDQGDSVNKTGAGLDTSGTSGRKQ